MKVDELRILEADELGMRLRTARRELYELRFKHAVGQLENSSQISKVRHDIARIMTVLRERDFGIGPSATEDAVHQQAVAVAEPQVAELQEAEPEEETPSGGRGPKAQTRAGDSSAGPKRGRGRKKEEAE